jgi:NO-binding membrane sensor protein with MHYT domain
MLEAVCNIVGVEVATVNLLATVLAQMQNDPQERLFVAPVAMGVSMWISHFLLLCELRLDATSW